MKKIRLVCLLLVLVICVILSGCGMTASDLLAAGYYDWSVDSGETASLTLDYGGSTYKVIPFARYPYPATASYSILEKLPENDAGDFSGFYENAGQFYYLVACDEDASREFLLLIPNNTTRFLIGDAISRPFAYCLQRVA